MRARRPIRAVRPAPGAGPVPEAPRDRRRSYERATAVIPVGLMTWADGRSPPRIGGTRDARRETIDHLLRPPSCRRAPRIDGEILGCFRRHTNTHGLRNLPCHCETERKGVWEGNGVGIRVELG